MIIIIQGPAKSGKSYLAHALRNDAINKKRGALIIDEDTEADYKPLIEKLIEGDSLPTKEGSLTDIDTDKIPSMKDIKWKKDAAVILVGKNADADLAKIEKLLPGFTDHHGPVVTWSVTKGLKANKA